MARRGNVKQGRGGIGGAMKDLFGGLAMVAIFLAMILFVMYYLENKAVTQYIDLNGYANETVCGTECTEIRSGFNTGEDVVILGLGLLGLIAVVMVFVGFLLPVIQRVF